MFQDIFLLYPGLTGLGHCWFSGAGANFSPNISAHSLKGKDLPNLDAFSSFFVVASKNSPLSPGLRSLTRLLQAGRVLVSDEGLPRVDIVGPLGTNPFCLFFFSLAVLRGMRDISSPTRDRTCAPCVEVRSLNHWTIREVALFSFLNCILWW